MTDKPDLRDLRDSAGKTQVQVAAFLGTAQAAVSQWEYGKAAPDEEGVRGLARLYSVEVDVVLDAIARTEAAWEAARDTRLAEAIRSLRVEQELSMTALADAAGVTAGAVGFWESGVTRPSVSTLPLVAGALGREVAALLEEAGYSSDEVAEYLDDGEDEPLPIALLLRRGREEAGLTQNQVAAALGTSQNNVSAIETGVHLPNDDFVGELTNLYELDPTDVDGAMYASLIQSGRVPTPTLPLPLDPQSLPRDRWMRQMRAHRGQLRSDFAAWIGVDLSVIARGESTDADGLPAQLCRPAQLRKLALASQCTPGAIIAAYEPDLVCDEEMLVAEDHELPGLASSIAELLRALNLRGWTLQELGDAAGVTREAVRQWRNGNTIPRLSSVVGLTSVLPSVDEHVLETLIKRARNPEPLSEPQDLSPPATGTPEAIFDRLG